MGPPGPVTGLLLPLQDAHNLPKRVNNILTTEVSIKLLFRNVMFGGSE
jgi:hypothetical protein